MRYLDKCRRRGHIKFIICAFGQCYNEKKNLRRWLSNVKKFADILAVYDDGSIDGSKRILAKKADIFISAERNDWKNEITHKKMLLEKCYKEHPEIDAYFWLDMDEITSTQVIENMENIVGTMLELEKDGMAFCNIALWKSENFYRKHFPY